MSATDTPIRRASHGLVPALFTSTIFLSAALLFFVQPLFSRLALPEIGGAPAVWTTAMLFFQSVLLAGYIYAHLTTRHLGTRVQVALHMALWAMSLFFLPLAIPETWSLDPEAPVAWQTLTLFALGVGAPFALLSANAPLIQSWYRGTGGPSADDPYFLYGASNLGSFAALLAFPLLAEPLFGATAIGWIFAAGFLVLGAGLAASGLAAGQRPPGRRAVSGATIPLVNRLHWAALAFVPSSLMLAVTTKVSTDIGALPLVWVIPLALFLLTFVLTFSRGEALKAARLRVPALGALLLSFAIFLGLFGNHLGLGTLALLVGAFFVLALWCHRRLYEMRPHGAALTSFYIVMSIGGALGGLFNAIVAPTLFNDLIEGTLTLAVAAALILMPATGSRLAAISRSAAILAVCVGAIWATSPVDTLFRDRSFFGTHKVIERNGLRLYVNGTTVHGAQRIGEDRARPPEPLFYYHPEGPMAEVLTSSAGQAAGRIGIVGLGIGSLACYARPGQDWHFYEIDATVARVARKPSLFRFMTDCAPDAPVHMGDARIVLEGQTDLRFDILVIDAFSSDAVPVHLLTSEALGLYLDRLAPGGLLLFHISNRYYDLARPLGRSAGDRGLASRFRHHTGDLGRDAGHSGSVVALLARDEDALAPFSGGEWGVLADDGGRLWTDDYANLLGVLR